MRTEDTNLINDIARILGEDDEKAIELRRAIRAVVAPPRAETGEELVAFFRNAPFDDDELVLERDPSGGRTASFD